MAQTLIFLQESGFEDYEALAKASDAVYNKYNQRVDRLREVEKRLAEIQGLQKQMKMYGQTREAYAQYKKSGYSKKFYEAHRPDIILHETAKKYFDSLGYGRNNRLPSMQSLKQEYATLSAEKKKLYSGYKVLKEKYKSLLTAKDNTERILGIGKYSTVQNTPRKHLRSNSHAL